VHTAWLSSRALRLHLTLVLLVTAFCLLARWQVGRAVDGNTLSWAYAFEWPIFALYSFVIWWRLLHDEAPRRRRAPSTRRIARDAAADAERETYNAYLASLHNPEPAEQHRP
jgi:hypothetical protein